MVCLRVVFLVSFNLGLLRYRLVDRPWPPLTPPPPSPVAALEWCPAKQLLCARDTGREGGIEAGVALLRELGDHRDVQENACWLLTLLSQVAEFSRR